MTPIRLFSIATLASCGLFLASPAMPATSAPKTAAAVAIAGSDTVRVHTVKRDRDRSHSRSLERDRREYRKRKHDHYRWDYDRSERWRTRRHPRHPYWKGRHLPSHGRYLVIVNYWDYHLPPPPYRHFYVRDGSDVFLVLEATRLIVDSFILFELLSR